MLSILRGLLLLSAFGIAYAQESTPVEVPQINVDQLTDLVNSLPPPTVIVPVVPEQVVLPIKATSALVVDIDSNEVLYSQNANEIRPLASVTKLMTALVLIKSGVNLDEKVAITQEDVYNTRYSSMRSRLRPGMQFTRRELLVLALMASENRAAAILARTTFPGGLDEFITAMNSTAFGLGMTNTHYADPTGLLAENVSTASDLLLLAKAVNEIDLLREDSTEHTYQFQIGATRKHQPVYALYHTTNVLIALNDTWSKDRWKIELQKTGYIQAAMHTTVLIMTDGTKRYAVIMLNTPSNVQRAIDTTVIRVWLETGKVPTRADLVELLPKGFVPLEHSSTRKHTSKLKG